MTAKEQIERLAIAARITGLELATMSVAEFAERVDSVLAKREADRHELEVRSHCSCVRMNSAIGIHDMGQQERANRYGMGAGLVSNTYSTDRSCTKCGGTGEKA